MAVTIWTKDKIKALAERVATDFGAFAYDGFGIMLTDEQLEARRLLGRPGPRRQGEFKHNWVSGGQRSGKTVEGFLYHAEACLYKIGLDNTDRRFWENYAYNTLAIAPLNETALRLWTVGDSIQKNANEAQWDSKTRRARGGAFLGKFRGGTVRVGQVNWPAFIWDNGATTDFRTSEGGAARLEGGQWWWITWDEWASQPFREIRKVLWDVLAGRSRDHDAKIMPMAWPKPETEAALIQVIRGIQKGRDRDSQVIYLDAEKAFFTNKAALATELEGKSQAEIDRTIHGKPAGGASIEFKPDEIENATVDVPLRSLPEDGYDYFNSWDLGLGNDDTVGLNWRIPIVDGRRVVSPEFKARIVGYTHLPADDSLTLDAIAFNVTREQVLYRAQTAVDATGMGGLAAFRQLRDLVPKPFGFKSVGNDRVWGNMRLAAITNGLDLISWGRPEGDDTGILWGCIEFPPIVELLDQLALFDRDANPKDLPDDWVWSFLIGCWYIRRFWVVGNPGIHVKRAFDVRAAVADAPIRRRSRGRLVPGPGSVDVGTNVVVPAGVRFLRGR